MMLNLNSERNRMIWYSLSFQAGVINCGGFMACHRFVTHVTGFATHFGNEIATAHYQSAFGILTVPFFFLLGAFCTGYFTEVQISRGNRPRYYNIFGFIAIVMISVALFGHFGQLGVFGEPINVLADYILLGVLCFCSGTQNATVTSASGSVIRTTHLTGITTDLGLSLMKYFALYPRSWKTSDHLTSQRSKDKLNILIRMGLILSFILGSVFGGMFFLNFEYLGFLLPATISLILSMITFKNRNV